MKTNNSEEVKINLNGIKCFVKFFKYYSGRIGFRLFTIDDGQPLAVCTIDVDGCSFVDNEVIIKNYSENTGMYNALLANNFILPYNRRVSVGYNYGLVCKLNTDYKNNF